MVSLPRVVEDAREDGAAVADRLPWGWFVSGLVIGGGLAVLSLGIDAVSPVTETTVAVEPGSEEPGVGGLSAVVEGFPDGLVATMRSDGRSLDLLIWPVAGEPYDRSLPIGVSSPPSPVEFDVSGRRIATVTPVPGQASGVLYAGDPEFAAVIDLEVTGFAWHDSAPGSLAYTTLEDGEFLLWTTTGNLAESHLVTRAVGIDGAVAAWGDWGFAIEEAGEESVVLLTPAGEIKAVQSGHVLDSRQDGWLAIDDEGLWALSAGGGLQGIEGSSDVHGAVAGAFSPDGESLAVLTPVGAIVLLGDTETPMELGLRPASPYEVVWSSDSRFILVPGLRGVTVLDTASGEPQDILEQATISGIGILPVGGS